MLAHIIHSLSTTVSSPSLTPREALSGVSGSVSLACWLFLLLPQLLENYRNGSADAISLGFIFIWFLGDVCNLWGAVWAGLVPTVIAIGVYFCIADGVLIGQVMYYRIRSKRQEGKGLLSAARESVIVNGIPRKPSDSSESRTGANGWPSAAQDDADEEEPLLSRRLSLHRPSNGSITIPGSGKPRRPSSASLRRQSTAQDEPLARILEESDSKGTRLWFKNTLSILAICAVGTVGWALAYESKTWKPVPIDSHLDHEHMAIGAQVLGYASAVAYLGARLPQIYKNWKDQSCEGLSLLFFILSLLGNFTYGIGILAHSTESQYIITNLPWLIGSFGTMVEDVTIFIQFHLYRVDEEDDEEDVAVT